MTGTSRILPPWRSVLLFVAITILAYLFALLATVIPAQLFLPCGGFSCPLILGHDTPVQGGFTRNYLYSITYQLTHFGSTYNVDDGYSLPSGLYVPGLGITTSIVTLSIIVLPLLIVAIVCLCMYVLSDRQQAGNLPATNPDSSTNQLVTPSTVQANSLGTSPPDAHSTNCQARAHTR